jgi:hypothetical protein
MDRTFLAVADGGRVLHEEGKKEKMQFRSDGETETEHNN